MALSPGTQVGQYAILSLLGRGGMGEVYRARDQRLDRNVAIKVLPESLATDPERIVRFEREAKTLAALNHPNIAHIHGLEESNGIHALVMELVEGPTLADRIAKGPLPLDEALAIAKQIAEALEAAHEQGIIHRDLKPDNVKVRGDGTVKVLDFGLAKLVAPVATESGATLTVTGSPTITSPAMMTGVGVILGTAAYMSPEQAKGRPADRRSDIWAFGCVLYEMLAGTRAFPGTDVSDTVANVLKTEPDWEALPGDTPRPIRRLLRRCLEKDRTRRFADITDARLEIDDASTVPDDQRDTSHAPRVRATWRGGVPWVISIALALALLIGWLKSRSAAREHGAMTRVELNVPDGVELFTTAPPAFAISPDGTRVAFQGIHAGVRQLYVRRLDESQAVPMRGPFSIAWCCFFSPDSDAVGFIQSNLTVAKVTLADGLVVPLASDADFSAGATWTRDGRIIFIRHQALWQVPASGGRPQPLLALDREKGEVAHAWPSVIDGTNAILFTSMTGSRRDAHIEALSLATGKRQFVVAGTVPAYASRGYLVFFRDGALFAVPFDADRLAVTGTPVRVVDDVAVSPRAPFAAVSRTGTLVYVSTGAAKSRLVWVTRQGLEQPVSDVERDYSVPRLAPDGRRIVVAAGRQLWIHDTQRATFTRMTLDDTIGALLSAWTPDGTRVVFNTATGLQWVETDGAGRAHTISDTFVNDYPTSVSPDGNILAFSRLSGNMSADIYQLSLHGEPKPQAVVNTPATEGGADFSPDGRWLAYASNDSGQMQVYVRPVAGPDRRWPVSTQGGQAPKWSRSGRELFYRDGEKMMVVSVSTGPELALSSPTLLFEHAYAFGPTQTVANYDVSPDGQRFLMIKHTPGAEHLNLVLNWWDELKRLAPTK
jgi:serine/threonine protein kinase/Tol biopolymer transport system component